MQQRASIKMNQGRANLSDFYELKDSNVPPPPSMASTSRNFKIPSSSDILEDVAPPPPPKPPAPSPRFSYQKFASPSPASSHDSESNLLANPRNIHCVVIADHIMDCPICSRFYRNYTPIYNVIILILGIALIILIIKCNNKNFPNYIRAAVPPAPTL